MRNYKKKKKKQINHTEPFSITTHLHIVHTNYHMSYTTALNYHFLAKKPLSLGQLVKSDRISIMCVF